MAATDQPGPTPTDLTVPVDLPVDLSVIVCVHNGATRMEMLVRDLLAYTQVANFDAPIATADANEAVVLEGAAVVVWNALEQPATDAQLVTAIAARLALAGDDVRADVAAARELLCRHRVLVGTPAPVLVGSND